MWTYISASDFDAQFVLAKCQCKEQRRDFAVLGDSPSKCDTTLSAFFSAWVCLHGYWNCRRGSGEVDVWGQASTDKSEPFFLIGDYWCVLTSPPLSCFQTCVQRHRRTSRRFAQETEAWRSVDTRSPTRTLCFTAWCPTAGSKVEVLHDSPPGHTYTY